MANYPTQVPLDEKELARLRNLYKNALVQISAELENATDFGVKHRRVVIAQIREILTELGDEINGGIEELITQSYIAGTDDAVSQLKASGAADIPVKGALTQIHKDVVRELVSETQSAFAESLQGVTRSTQRLLSNAVKEQISQQLAIGRISGANRREIKQRIIGILKTDGIDSLIDKRGRGWKLDTYADMLIPTKTVEARNRGLQNRMLENGYDLVEVSAHGAIDDCKAWEGRILSMTGKTPGYPTLQQAKDGGLFHPRCKHAINVLNPRLAKLTNAYTPDLKTMDGRAFEFEFEKRGKQI